MRIVICDDKQNDIDALQRLIDDSHELKTYPCAEALAADIEDDELSFDLYILDIFMEKMSGIELARRIRENDKNALICFTTTSQDYYKDAYKLYAFQYLNKPVNADDFREMLARASEKFADRVERSVTLSYRGKIVRVAYSEILYIESQNHTLLFYLKGGRVERQLGQISDYEALLDNRSFIRTHQSYIVNIKNMDCVDNNCFVCGRQRIPISRKYADAKEAYRSALFDDMR